MGGEAGNSDIHFLSSPCIFYFSILGKSHFSDVHPGDQFNSGSDGRLKVFGQCFTVMKNSINPETNLHMVFSRLDMNIRGICVNGTVNNVVHQLNHRGFRGHIL